MDRITERPSPRKIRRGIQLIEALKFEIYHHDDGTDRARNPFEMYPNWQTDPKDCAAMLRIARGIARSGIRMTVEAAGFGGEAGSQFITRGTYELPGKLNVRRILDRATERVFEREQRKRDQDIEAARQYLATTGELPKDWGSGLMDQRTKEDVRVALMDKWIRYKNRPI